MAGSVLRTHERRIYAGLSADRRDHWLWRLSSEYGMTDKDIGELLLLLPEQVQEHIARGLIAERIKIDSYQKIIQRERRVMDRRVGERRKSV